MKRLPIDYAILGHTYASALSDCLSSDDSGSVIYYLGEIVDYDYFANQLQRLAKNVYLKMTIIFDISMVEDKAKLTQYFVFLKAMFPSSRVIVVAPGLENEALISNVLSCGIYDIITDDLSTLSDSQRIAAVCRIVDTTVDHPKTFADIYHGIMWQRPVIKEVSSGQKKGFIARRKERKALKKAEKKARKESKTKVKTVTKEIEIDPYEAFLNGSNVPVNASLPRAENVAQISEVFDGYDAPVTYVDDINDLFE